MNRVRSVSLLLGLTSFAACGDSTGPNDIAGTYEATTFILTRTGSPPADVLAAGGVFSLVLVEDGRMFGNLLIPQSLTDDPQQFELFLEGTFTISDDRVRFRQVQQQDNNFLEEIAWSVGPNRLSGTYSDIDGTIEITLTRMETAERNAS